MLRYAITDRRLLGATEAERADALVEQAAQLAARGDIDYLQLREKDLPPAQLASLARRILEALDSIAQGAPFIRDEPALSDAERPRRMGKDADKWDAKRSRRPGLLINSRADVAIAVRADGVHLTSSPGELTPAQVRAVYSEAGLLPPTVSLSCHTLAEVVAARGPRARFGSGDELCLAPDPATTPDLILFGPVFEKRIGDQPVAKATGLELLRQACAAAAPIPVLALGGITEENAADCLDAGAAGIAAIRLFMSMAPKARLSFG